MKKQTSDINLSLVFCFSRYKFVIKLLNNMRTLLTTLVLAILAFNMQAANKKKSSTENQPFHKGSNSLGIGLGAGMDYGYYGTVSAIPTIFATFDHGIVDHLGPGNLGIGGIIGVKSASTTYFSNYKATWRNIMIGVRGTWHLTLLADKNSKFDPYGGVTAGFRINTYSNSYYSNNQLVDPYDYNHVSPITGVFVGAKYNFSQHFGVFAEAGYDISLFRGGLSINF